MRYFALCTAVFMLSVLSSCGSSETVERLAYQELPLHIEVDFTLDGETLPLTIELAAPEYDDSGRMLARDAALTIGEDSILAGVSFEAVGGDYYIHSGDLRIPIAEEDTVSGITDVISLFCISQDSYYSSEKIKHDGEDCELAVYKNGDNTVELILDSVSGLPRQIKATVDGRELTADITAIQTE